MTALVISILALIVSGIAMWRTLRPKSQPVEARSEDSDIAAQWLIERAKHPAGSPRYVAFTNRLRSIGRGD